MKAYKNARFFEHAARQDVAAQGARVERPAAELDDARRQLLRRKREQAHVELLHAARRMSATSYATRRASSRLGGLAPPTARWPPPP